MRVATVPRPARRKSLIREAARMRVHAEGAAQLLKALANEKRLLVLCLLAERERSVGQLNHLLELSQSALSQHLAVLRSDGIVITRREAQTIYYGLAPGPARRVIELLHDHYCGSAGTATG